MATNTVEKGAIWRALFALVTGTALIFLDSTILPVALPTIQKVFGASDLLLQWIVNIYTLVASATMIACGRIADLFGHRKLYCWGLVIFSFASIVGGVAVDTSMLLICRGLQGIGCAIIGPTSFALVVEAFPEHLRGRLLGIMVGIASIFLSLGPVIGGIFSEYISWRLIFWVNIPIAAIGLWLVLKFIPPSKKSTGKFDVAAFFLLTLSLVGLVLAMMQGREWGWGSPGIIILFVVSVSLFVTLYFVEKRAQQPFVDFSLFKIRFFTMANLTVFISSLILMLTVFWPIYFQKTLGFSATKAGLVLGMATITLLVFSPLGGILNDKFGPRMPISIGYVLVLFATIWFFYSGANATVLSLMPALLTFGGGMAMVMAPAGVSAASSVPDENRGKATGLYMTIRYLGSTIGIAVIGAMIGSLREKEFFALATKRGLTEQFSTADLDAYVNELPPSSSLSPEALQKLEAIYQKATVSAFSSAELFAILLAFVALVLVLLFFKKSR